MKRIVRTVNEPRKVTVYLCELCGTESPYEVDAKRHHAEKHVGQEYRALYEVNGKALGAYKLATHEEFEAMHARAAFGPVCKSLWDGPGWYAETWCYLGYDNEYGYQLVPLRGVRDLLADRLEQVTEELALANELLGLQESP